MADVSITVANVQRSTGAIIETGYAAGETITAGQALYLKTSDLRWWKAQADGTSAEATFGGIALHGALAGQPLAVQTSGLITIGGTVVVGGVYVVSATAGGIAPLADLVTGNYVSIVGYATTAALLQLNPANTGVAVP